MEAMARPAWTAKMERTVCRALQDRRVTPVLQARKVNKGQRDLLATTD